MVVKTSGLKYINEQLNVKQSEFLLTEEGIDIWEMNNLLSDHEEGEQIQDKKRNEGLKGHNDENDKSAIRGIYPMCRTKMFRIGRA